MRQISEYKVDWLQQDLSINRLDWYLYLTDSAPRSESETGKSFHLKVWICMKEEDNISLPTMGILG